MSKKVESLDNNKEEYIKIISEDGKSISVLKKYAEISGLIKTALEEANSENEIKLLSVSSNTLQDIERYMNYYKGKPPSKIKQPLQSKDMKKDCNEFDHKFITSFTLDKKEDLSSLINAANYMDIQPLLYLGCARFASFIKGETLNNIEKIFKKKS